MTKVHEITATEASEWVQRGEAILLDVREDQELAEARIADALHNPMSKFDLEAVPKDDDKKLVIFCAHGMRSFQIADYLTQQDILNEAYSMEGGIVAWAQAGLPYDQG